MWGTRRGAAALALAVAPLAGWAAERGGPAAGPVAQVQVGLRDQTAWEAVKEQLAAFMRGYVERDVTGALQALSRDFTQDEAVLRNAILRDFQLHTDLNIDLELQDYRTRFEGAAVSLNWFRTATLQSTGGSVVSRGSARVIHDRHDGYRLLTWQGPAPFGLTDPTWVRQTEVGDPSLEGRAVQTQSFSGLDSDPGDPENLAVDLEELGGNVTRFRDADCPGCAAAPKDLVLSFVQVLPHLAVAFFSTSKSPEIDPVGDNAVPPGAIDCPGATTLEDVGSVDPNALQLFKTNAGVLNVFPGGGGPIVFGVVTDEGNYGVLEVQVKAVGGSLVDATLRWRIFGPDPGGGTSGGAGC